jgi:hypothetical protein
MSLVEIGCPEEGCVWLPHDEDPMVCAKCQDLHKDYSFAKLVTYVKTLEDVVVMLGKEMLTAYTREKQLTDITDGLIDITQDLVKDVNNMKDHIKRDDESYRDELMAEAIAQSMEDDIDEG